MNRLALARAALFGLRARRFAEALDPFVAAGYAFATHRAYAEGAFDPGRPVVFPRFDVDAPSPACPALLAASAARGAAGSWYFRRSTLDPAFMRAVEASGGEASFHYETVAEYARDHRLATAAALGRRAYEPACLARLARDLATLRARTGLPCRTVASHGHALNRALGIPNNALLEERARLAPLGLVMEAYDRDFIAGIDAVVCDCPAELNGGWLYGVTPESAARRGARRVLLQVHPHHWAAAPAARIRRAAACLLRGPRTSAASFRRL